MADHPLTQPDQRILQPAGHGVGQLAQLDGEPMQILAQGPSLDFSCSLAGSGGGGAGWLVGLIVVGGYDRSPGVAPVGRAFLGPVGSFVLSGQGQGSGC